MIPATSKAAATTQGEINAVQHIRLSPSVPGSRCVPVLIGTVPRTAGNRTTSSNSGHVIHARGKRPPDAK